MKMPHAATVRHVDLTPPPADYQPETFDIAAKLPSELSRDVFITIRDQATEARDRYEAAYERWQRAREEADQHWVILQSQMQLHQLAESSPLVKREMEKRDHLLSVLRHAKAKLDEAGAAQQSVRAVYRYLLNWITETPRNDIKVHFSEPPKLARGGNPEQMVQRAQETRRQLLDLAEKARLAPIPISVCKARARAQVAKIAESGAPNVVGLVRDGSSIEWPKVAPSVAYGAPSHVRMPDGTNMEVVSAGHTVPDGLAFTVWLNYDSVIARLEKTIDAMSDDAAAMTDEERASRLQELDDQILEAEREECFWIREAQGSVPYRKDCDPRAILGLDGPAPREP